MIRSILHWLFSAPPLRCYACGLVHETTDTLDADYPSGSICSDQCACVLRRINAEAMKQSANHMTGPED